MFRRVDKGICKIAGHLWHYANNFPAPNGQITYVYRCDRCGHIKQEYSVLVYGSKNIPQSIDLRTEKRHNFGE